MQRLSSTLPVANAGDSKPTYKAFISYSHAADGKLAPTLQSALQTFAKPWYRVRAFSVFRDDTNLSVTPALWPAIETALGKSEFFILLASHEAAASKWVRQEIEFWLTNRSKDKLLIVQTGGEIQWSDSLNDFEWSKTTALPAILSHVFKSEPFYLDLSWAKSPDEQLSLRHSDFRKAVLKLAATLSGREMAELDSEEVRQHRKNIRAAWMAGVALVALTITSIIAAILFLQQKREAENQRNTAFARQLAAESTARLNQNIDLALLLSIEGLEIRNSVETRAGLLRALQYSPFLSGFLYGHTNIVRNVVIHPKGTILASADDDGNILLWDLINRRPLGQPLNANKGAVTSLAFSPDGNYLVSGNGEDKESSIIMWNVDTRAAGPVLPGPGGAIFNLSFSRDGQTLAGRSEGKVFFWTLQNRQFSAQPLEVNGNVEAVVFDPAKDVIALGSGDGSVSFRNAHTREVIGHPLVAKKESIDKIAFSKNGDLLAVGYHDGSIAIWNVMQQQLLKEISEANGLEIMGIDFSPKGDAVAAGFSDGTISLFSIASEKPIGTVLRGHRLAIGAVAFGHDGKTLASGGFDGNVILWNLFANVPLGNRYENFNGKQVEAVSTTQDGSVIGVTREGDAAILWDVVSGKMLGQLFDGAQGPMWGLALDPNGKYLATGYENHRVVLWDAIARQPLLPVMEAHQGRVGRFAFSADSKMLASADDEGLIYIWDTGTRQLLSEPAIHIKGILRLVFSRDGKMLVSGAEDGSIKFWSVPDGRPLGSPITGHNGAILSIAISPDGKVVATGGTAVTGSKIYLWDVETRRALGEPLQDHKGPVKALMFSPDGTTLASGAWDYRIVLWDVVTRRPVGLALTGHQGGVETLLYSTDGKRLISSGLDDAVIVWDVDVESWKQRACGVANRNLSCSEWAQFFIDLPYRPACASPGYPPDCSQSQ